MATVKPILRLMINRLPVNPVIFNDKIYSMLTYCIPFKKQKEKRNMSDY